MIVLWWDESEGGDTSAFTLPFMVISKDIRERRWQAFASSVEYSHSSFVRTCGSSRGPHHGFVGFGTPSKPTICRRCSPGVVN